MLPKASLKWSIGVQLFGLLFSSIQSNSQPAQEGMHSIVSDLSSIAAISAGMKDRSRQFLLMTTNVCHSCLEEAMAMAKKNPDLRLDIVMIGESSESIDRLNAIYNRMRIRFFSFPIELEATMREKYGRRLDGLFIGMRISSGGKVILYDGVDEYSYGPERVDAVVRFVLLGSARKKK